MLNLYIFVFFSEENTPAPCGSSRATACAKAVEGRFADWTEDCKFYYTCNDGLYYGHNPCPEGTYMEDIEMKLQTDILNSFSRSWRGRTNKNENHERNRKVNYFWNSLGTYWKVLYHKLSLGTAY